MSEAKAGSGKLQLHWKMLIGFLAGLALGLVAHYGAGSDAGWVQWLTTYVTQPAGTLFLRLIFMLVIPLLFSALIIGVAEMGDVRSLGRVGWKTLGYTVIASGIAVALGLLLVNWLQPGAGVDPAAAQAML
ncbi:MAG TPA: cation:dicarboxylase symporter family transporter, partial [Thermomonas sp.]|nr:cation:dicarboxylase symporter family transporter [Thermomonas sp.]